jgi:hypothetical protein
MSELHKVDALPEKEAPGQRSQRRRTLLSGKIVSDNGGAGRLTFDCTVRKLSGDGAQISLPRGLFFGDECFLVIPQRRIAYEARVIWRRSNDVGLEFGASTPLDYSPDPFLTFLSKHND